MCPGEKFQSWMTLTAVFMISFPFMCRSQTSLQIIDSPSPVEAILGENVTIPCVLTDTKDPQKVLDLNLITDSVRWDRISRNGSIHTVYLFTEGITKHNVQRSNINGKEFKRGIASLTLYNVQKSDEGEYVCHLYVGGNKISAARTLETSARPVVTLSLPAIEVVLGNEQSVTCFVRKFYPESVKIRWEKFSASSKRSALDKETCTSVPTVAEDGTFIVTSLMSVRPSSTEESGDNYSCIVSHRSLKSEHAVHFTVTVLAITDPPNYTGRYLGIAFGILILMIVVAAYCLLFRKRPPKILNINGIDELVHAKSSTLSWTVSDFRPKNIEINAYLKRGVVKQKIRSWKYPSPQSYNSGDLDGSSFTYSVLCSINITPDKRKDKDAELFIEVIHGALNSILTESCKLTIRGDYFTSHIISRPYLIHGEVVTLTCDIIKCDPGPLSITWLKGNKVVYVDGNIQDERYLYEESLDKPHEDGMLILSSSLKFTVQVKEDLGIKYTCKVDYPKIGKILAPHLDTSVTARPVVEPIVYRNVNQKIQLSSSIHSFHPKTIVIKWYKEDEELPLSENELIIGEDHLYSTTSILTFTPEQKDIGKTYKCEVDHQSLKNPEIRKWKLKD